MSRPTDWWVLDLESDPTPGSVQEAEQLARRLHEFADRAEYAHQAVNSMQGDDAVLAWVGMSGDKFREQFGEFPSQIDKVHRSHRMAADALVAFGPKLLDAQSDADRALADGRNARSSLDAANAALSGAQNEASSKKQATETITDPEQLKQATRDAQAADQQLTTAQGEVSSAQSALEAAKALAEQARQMRTDAAGVCAKAINDASDAGIQPRSFWEKLADGFKMLWDAICEIAKWVALVAGVIAMIIGGPLAWVALAAGAILLIKAVVDFAGGKGSVLDLVFGILGVIPGVKGLTTLGKLKDLYQAGGVLAIGKNTLNSMKEFAAGAMGALKNIVKNGVGAIGAKFNDLPFLTSKTGKQTPACGDPIDISTGRMFHSETDLEMAGELAITLTRTHRSDLRHGRFFGPSWASTLDQRVQVEDGGVHLVLEDGSLLSYPEPDSVGPVHPQHGTDRPLRRTGDGGFVVSDPESGRRLWFGKPDDEGAAALSAITEGEHRIDVLRDGLGVPVEVRHSGGARVTVGSIDGLITAYNVLGSDGRPVLVREFDYDDEQRLVGTVNGSGLAMAYGYDRDGRIERWQDRVGMWYAYDYDGAGRCIRTTGKDGFLNYTFDYRPGRTRATDSLGHVTTFTLNDQLQVTAVTDPLGRTTTSQWDAKHRLLSRTDPLGRITTWTYHTTGAVTQVTLPDGRVITLGYDRGGRPIEVVGPGGARWGFEHDRDGVLLARTDPGGTVFTFGGETPAGAKALGSPAAIEPPPRDDFGRIVADDANRYEWTADGHLLRRTTADGGTESRTYDAEGNLLSVLDARGHRTSFEYGPFDLMTARIDATGARMTYTWDTEMRLTAVTNELGQIWRYDYDPAGRLSREVDFAGREHRYEWDAAGQLVRFDDRFYTYDLLGNLIEERAGDHTVGYTWNEGGLLTAADCLELRRDALGRVVAESIDGEITSSAFDGAGRRVRTTTPSGVDVAWTWDEQGRAATATVAGHVLDFTYDAAGYESARQLDGVFYLATERDAGHRPSTRILVGGDLRGNPALIDRRVLTRVNGDLVAIEDRADRREITRDALGRVIGIGAERYAFDPIGTLTSPATGDLQSHDAAGRLTGRTAADGRQWLHEWDAFGRMRAVTTPDGDHWTYRYDGLGRRVAKESARERVEFSWLGYQLVEQRSFLGGISQSITWVHHPVTGEVVAQVEDGQVFAVVTDEVGTPTDLIDTGGNRVWQRAATLWGLDTSTETPLRFAGQYHDAETGLHYNVHRYYDPGTARYVSPDPLGLLPGPNPYAYVPDPFTASDPVGLYYCSEYFGMFPKNDYVLHVGRHADTQGWSQRGVRESEHVMPTQAVQSSGIWSPGVRNEISISIPYSAHRAGVDGMGGGVSSTGRSTTATNWPADLSNQLANGQGFDAYKRVLADELNVDIRAAGGLCHYVDQVVAMPRPVGVPPRLTAAEGEQLKQWIADTFWRNQ